MAHYGTWDSPRSDGDPCLHLWIAWELEGKAIEAAEEVYEADCFSIELRLAGIRQNHLYKVTH